MIRQCFLANTGIQFHHEAFRDIGMDPAKILDPRPPAFKASAYVPPTENGASAHVAEPTEDTLTDEVQASPTAASTFKSEEDEELVDALSPIYDELQLSWGWWILEFIPLRHRHQDREGLWHKYWSYVFSSQFYALSVIHVCGVIVLQDEPWRSSPGPSTKS
jgi:hypothetical protein